MVGITPGQSDEEHPEQRSKEYDTVSDVNATFLDTEVLPIIEDRWNISHDPARRCTLGGSSGGIAAFSVAWFRPDLFGCVISWVGSFTNVSAECSRSRSVFVPSPPKHASGLSSEAP